ncbi:MAG: hypothetical protein ACXAC7_09155 [Candidatus Hodarchaeales archaeon]
MNIIILSWALLGILIARNLTTNLDITFDFISLKLTVVKNQLRLFHFPLVLNYSGMRLNKIKKPSSWKWAKFNPINEINFDFFDCLIVDKSMKEIQVNLENLLNRQFMKSNILPTRKI